jgi:hypothetical protein
MDQVMSMDGHLLEFMHIGKTPKERIISKIWKDSSTQQNNNIHVLQTN